jgi:hypothetical protein
MLEALVCPVADNQRCYEEGYQAVEHHQQK